LVKNDFRKIYKFWREWVWSPLYKVFVVAVVVVVVVVVVATTFQFQIHIERDFWVVFCKASATLDDS